MSEDQFLYRRIHDRATTLLAEVRRGMVPGTPGRDAASFSGALFAILSASQKNSPHDTDHVGAICAVLVRDAMTRKLSKEETIEIITKRMSDYWEAAIDAAIKVNQEQAN